ncbi:MAG TPA: hypothetical protein VGC35_05915 [Allosphingosinicella sp.]|jgi:hypothetical protein
MDEIAGLPFAELHLDKDGQRVDPHSAIIPSGITDLIVISHGWKNERGHAIALYEGLLRNVAAAGGAALGSGGRSFGVTGIFWPALHYRSDLTLVPADPGVPHGQGGAASTVAQDLSRAALRAEAETFAADLGVDPAAFGNLAVRASGGGAAADEFVEALRDVLGAAPEPEIELDHAELFSASGADLVEALSQGGSFEGETPLSPTSDGDPGGAAGFSSVTRKGWRLLSGGKSAVASLLNQASYFEMKKRAGIVGSALASLLEREDLRGLRVHLVGHSFGARLASAAANEMRDLRPASLSLLQGAFSHNGFGSGIGAGRIDGGFRQVVAGNRVTGPILVTHTHRDVAVGFFYAVASTVSGEIAKGLTGGRIIGGADDLHGGIGANGALALAVGESVHLKASKGTPPALTAGLVNNVLADEIVSGHNDVVNPDVGALVWNAIA